MLGAWAPCRGKVSPRNWDWERCRFTMTVGRAETHRNNLSLSCNSLTRQQPPQKIPPLYPQGEVPSLQGAQLSFIYPAFEAHLESSSEVVSSLGREDPGRQGLAAGPSLTRQGQQRHHHHHEPKERFADLPRGLEAS